MGESFIIALATFFATVGPFDVAAVYAALGTNTSAADKRRMAVRGVLLAALILFIFALAGDVLLRNLGISLPAFRAAGGILLLLIGIDMVFARQSGGASTTKEENREAAKRQDIAVFPIAMPLIAGPGTMGAVILLMTSSEGDWVTQAMTLAALSLILILTLVSMILAEQLQRFLGVTGMHVISRIFGVLLTALAVQFIFDGIAQSGIFSVT
ncbi:MAG: MarC family protein [Gammaproteobacteria bacterium WSBS_2016_MAG_OTU1]